LNSENSETIKCILRELQAGDMKAFRQLFDKYKNRVYAVAFGMLGNRGKANEVTQDVFVRIYRLSANIDINRPFFTYLYRITVNACRDFMKREGSKKLEALSSAKSIQSSAGNPETIYAKQEKKEVIRQVANRLSPQQRTVFVLRHLEGFTLDEIGQILNCKAATVRAHLHFARTKIKKIIEKEYPEFLEE